jgi:hypothetical protein
VGRRRLPVTVPVPGQDAAEAAELLTAAVERVRHRPGRRGDLRLRVRPDGAVRVRRLSHQYTTYPRLRGRLERGPDGRMRVAGEAVENGAELFLVGINLVLTLGLLAGLVASIVDGALGGVLVCGAGTLAFGWLTWTTQRGRRGFPADVEDLIVVLQRALRG